MDGGNFTNYGWCPSNYSAMERMLLGWLTPVELTEPASITDLEPVEYGGNAYIIRHTDTEFLMLENRQWKGWDLGVPGKGLVIYHVNYNSSVWTNNSLNNDPTQRGFDLVHADNMNYVEWDNYRSKMGYSKYQNSNRMNSRILSTSPYPWRTDSAEAALDSLTDFSVPATVMFTANTQDSKLLSKPSPISWDLKKDWCRLTLWEAFPSQMASNCIIPHPSLLIPLSMTCREEI
jgi:hypothetical protein